jgi:hypothetical protein
LASGLNISLLKKITYFTNNSISLIDSNSLKLLFVPKYFKFNHITHKIHYNSSKFHFQDSNLLFSHFRQNTIVTKNFLFFNLVFFKLNSYFNQFPIT